MQWGVDATGQKQHMGVTGKLSRSSTPKWVGKWLTLLKRFFSAQSLTPQQVMVDSPSPTLQPTYPDTEDPFLNRPSYILAGQGGISWGDSFMGNFRL